MLTPRALQEAENKKSSVENTSCSCEHELMSSFRLHSGENHVSHDVTQGGHGFPAGPSEMLEYTESCLCSSLIPIQLLKLQG